MEPTDIAQIDLSEKHETKEIHSLIKNNEKSEREENIDIGIDATTLPPVDFKQELLDTSDKMFENIQSYLSSEIDVTIEDYKLIESLNTVTQEKYKGMVKTGENIAESMEELNEKFITILPKLELIDHLDKKIEHLEKLAYAIDAYSKRLEKQYKAMEKRIASIGNLEGNTIGESSSSTLQTGRF